MHVPDGRALVLVTTGFDEWQGQLADGMATAAGDRPVLVINAYNPTGGKFLAPLAQLLRGRPSLGVVATPLATSEDEAVLLDVLRQAELPVVCLGMQADGLTSVRADDAAGVRAVMAHLLDDLQVRRPVFVRGLRHQPDAQRREAVFRAELAARGIPVDEELMIDGAFWHDTSYRELRALLGRRRDLDAVVAANDNSALGAFKALAEAGLRLPEDVKLTGFDNQQAAAASWPGLTTVDNDLQAQGATAVSRLLTELAGTPPVPEVLVPGQLVVRGSTRPPQDLADEAVNAARLAHQRLSLLDALRFLSYRMNNATTPEAVVTALVDGHPPSLGVRRCFVALFSGDATDGGYAGYVGDRGDGDDARPRTARLLLDYRDGAAHPVDDGEEFTFTDLLPPRLRDELAAGLLILEPLIADDGMFGYLLCDQAPESWKVPDWLRGDLSRNLDAMLSRQALVRYAEELELAVQQRTAELEVRKAALETEVVMRRETEKKLQEANTQLQRLAMSDSLTQLANRAGLEAHLDQHWQELSPLRGELAVLMIDVDLFKAYNDHYGHVAGDEALRVVAARLTETARYPLDLACRYGGEEFVLILPGCGMSAARLVASRFQDLLRDAAIPHASSTVAPIVTVSIGVCVGRAQLGVPPLRLLEAADGALYRAKSGGRNRICEVELDQDLDPQLERPQDQPLSPAP